MVLTSSIAGNPEVALAVSDLCKSYPGTIAAHHVSFSVRNNEIVGLLGPNGAGKTTIISTILGLLAPTSGTVHIRGLDVTKERSRALSRTNFAAAYASLPGNLTVSQNLRLFGLIYGIPGLTAKIESLLEQLSLLPFRNCKVGTLSSGEQSRVALAKAFLNSPELLLLDEPTASLDPSISRAIRATIRRLALEYKCGILWTSHNMHEVEEVCDRVLFLARGRILLQGNPKTLAREHDSHSLEDLFVKLTREPLTASQDDQ